MARRSGLRPATPRLAGWLARWDEAVAGTALAVVFGAVGWGVVTRYVFPQPAFWTGEVAALGFAWVVFIGAAAAARRRLHVGVDLLSAALPARVRDALARLVSLVVAAILGYVAWLAGQAAAEAWVRPTAVLRLPYGLFYIAPCVGLTAMAFGALVDAVRGAPQ